MSEQSVFTASTLIMRRFSSTLLTQVLGVAGVGYEFPTTIVYLLNAQLTLGFLALVCVENASPYGSFFCSIYDRGSGAIRPV